MKRNIFLCLMLFAILAACSASEGTPSPTAVPLADMQPTEVPQPTPTPDFVISALTAEGLSQVASIPTSIFWNPQRTAFMSLNSDGNVLVWEPGQDQPVLILEGLTPVTRLGDWSRDGKYLAAYSEGEQRDGGFVQEGVIYIWEMPSGEMIGTIDQLTHWPSSIVFSPENDRLASADANGGVFMKLINVDETLVFENIGRHYIGLYFSPDASMIARINTGRYSSRSQVDGTVRVHNPEDGAIMATFSGHTQYVRQAAWSPDSAFLITLEDDWENPRSVSKIWNLARRSLEANLPAGGQNFAAWSPDGSMLVTAGNGSVNFWNTQDWQLILSHAVSASSRVVWSTDGSLLAFNSEGTTHVLDAASLDTVTSLEGGAASFAWSPSGAVFASGKVDGTVQLWNTSDWSMFQELQVGGYIYEVDWSHDDHFLSATSYIDSIGFSTSIWGVAP